MDIDTETMAYKNFKKSVIEETAYSIFGDALQVLTAPHSAVAAIMQGAHWLVSEGRYIDKFSIDGFKKGTKSISSIRTNQLISGQEKQTASVRMDDRLRRIQAQRRRQTSQNTGDLL